MLTTNTNGQKYPHSTPDTKDGKFVYRAEAQVDHVEDGDTWYGKHRSDPQFVTAQRTRANSEFPAGQWYRLTGIDTHETDGDKAQQAKKDKQFVSNFIKQGREESNDKWPFIVEFTDKNNEIEGDYGRLLVDLRRKSDGRSLAQTLLDEFGDDIRYQGNTTEQLREFATASLPQ